MPTLTTPEQLEEMTKQRQEGKTFREIGQNMNISPDTVYYQLTRMKVHQISHRRKKKKHQVIRLQNQDKIKPKRPKFSLESKLLLILLTINLINLFV